MTTNPVVNELLNLVAQLRVERNQLVSKLEEHDTKIRAVETTIQLYAEVRDVGEVKLGRATADDIRGMPQLQALIKIAQLNGGLVNASEAKRLFIQASLTKGNPKHAGPHIYNLLKNSDRFQWESPGTFRLITNYNEKQPPLVVVN